MFGLGSITWLGGALMGAIMGGFIFTRIMDLFWDSAPEVVRLVGFRRRVGNNRDRNADEELHE